MLMGGRPQGGREFFFEVVCALFPRTFFLGVAFRVTFRPAQAVAGHNSFSPKFPPIRVAGD